MFRVGEDLVENPVFEERRNESVRRGELDGGLHLHELGFVHLEGVSGRRADHLNTHDVEENG